MTLTIKEQIDGLLAYAEYQEAQAEALCERFWGKSRGIIGPNVMMMPPMISWFSEEISTCEDQARRARVEARKLREQNNA
jgi:hypothetical protein